MRLRHLERPAPARPPVEDAPWFRELPAEHRERLRELAAEDEARWLDALVLERRRRIQVVVRTAFLFLIADVLVLGLGAPPWVLLVAPLVGAAAGLALVFCNAESLLSTLICGPLYFLVHWGLFGDGLGGFLALCAGTFMVSCASGYLGSRDEVRAYE